jgi:glycosyltransferase involved in cell wall biosynthesis
MTDPGAPVVSSAPSERPLRVVFVAHYFPPVNSAGAKRVEALSKYLIAGGHDVTVITTQKTSADGAFTEKPPFGVDVIELDPLGRECPSTETGARFEPMHSPNPSWRRRLIDLGWRIGGQIPDPRLPFALAFAGPWLAPRAQEAIARADVVVGSTPPWPMLLAAVIIQRRFGVRSVLDYRDQFSECHEMPGSRVAKRIEALADRALARRANGLVVVSEPMAQYYASFNPRVTVITNGFDPDILNAVRSETHWRARPAGQPLTIRYFGLVTPGRVPRNLLAALERLYDAGRLAPGSLCFEFYGNCDLVKKAVDDRHPDLGGLFAFHAAVPYREMLARAVTADYLLFSETSSRTTLSAQGILTSKLFEYLASGRPIIADISPETLAARYIQRAGPHHFVAETLEAFEERMSGPAFWSPVASVDHPFVRTLSRASQAEQYASELRSLLGPQDSITGIRLQRPGPRL